MSVEVIGETSGEPKVSAGEQTSGHEAAVSIVLLFADRPFVEPRNQVGTYAWATSTDALKEMVPDPKPRVPWDPILPVEVDTPA